MVCWVCYFAPGSCSRPNTLSYQHNLYFQPQPNALPSSVLPFGSKASQCNEAACANVHHGRIKADLQHPRKRQKKPEWYQIHYLSLKGSQELKLLCICCKAILSRGQLLNRLLESCTVTAFLYTTSFCLSKKILLSDYIIPSSLLWFVMIWWKDSLKISSSWCTFTAKACIFHHCCHGFIYTEQFM